MQVLDDGLQVEALEFLGVVERFAHRIGQGRIPVKHRNVQVVRPPVPVRGSAGPACERALAHPLVSFRIHLLSPSVLRFISVPYTRIAGSWKVTVPNELTREPAR